MEYRIDSWDKLDEIIDISHLEPSQTDFEECNEIKRLLNFDLGLNLPLLLRKRERPDFELSEIEGLSSATTQCFSIRTGRFI